MSYIGTFGPSVLDPTSIIANNQTSNIWHAINCVSNRPLNILENFTTVTLGSTITWITNSNAYRLSVANPNSSARLESKDRILTTRSDLTTVEICLSCSLSSFITGQSLVWGVFNSQEGFLFGRDAGGLYVAIRRNGVDTKTYQNNWSGTRLDGTDGNPVLNTTFTVTYIIEIPSNFRDPVRFKISGFNQNTQNSPIYEVHTVYNNGIAVVSNFPLSLTTSLQSASTGSLINVDVFRRSVFHTNLFPTTLPPLNTTRLTVPSAIVSRWYPVFSLRRKTTISRDLSRYRSLHRVSCFINTANQFGYLRLLGNPTLTSPAWADVTDLGPNRDSESQVDIAANNTAGGEVLWSNSILSRQPNNYNFFDIPSVNIDRYDSVALAVFTTTAFPVTFTLSWNEF
jgi:hypothetical protein